MAPPNDINTFRTLWRKAKHCIAIRCTVKVEQMISMEKSSALYCGEKFCVAVYYDVLYRSTKWNQYLLNTLELHRNVMYTTLWCTALCVGRPNDIFILKALLQKSITLLLSFSFIFCNQIHHLYLPANWQDWKLWHNINLDLFQTEIFQGGKILSTRQV